MKKTLKVLLLVAFMSVVLLALTGCGNKIVATRENKEDGITMNERIEITFKKDKITNINLTYEFDTKEMAESMEGYVNLMFASIGANVEQNGKKITIELDSEAFAKMAGIEEEEMTDISKKELKKQLEEDGYKVK